MRVLCLAVIAALAFATVSVAAQTAGPAANLQSLVNDFGVQLELRYRANLPEYQRRYEQLDQVVAAWNASARTDGEDAQLTAWLHGAIQSAMPGSDAAWPAVPTFGQPDAATGAPPAPVDVVSNKPVVPEQPDVGEELPPEPKEPAAQTIQPPSPPSVEPSPDEPPAAEPSAKGPDAAAAPAPAPTAQPAATESASPADTAVDGAAGGDAEFWLKHPAASELPDDVMLGDPFQDDPLPADIPLPSLPVLPDLP